MKDPLGRPVIRITGEYKENERKIAAFMQDKMEQWYRGGRSDCDSARAGRRRDGCLDTRVRRHAHGRQPETNVVDRYGLSHEVPNLGVLGGSVMGTSGAHNPTHTIQALAWRTADHVVKNWKAIARGA